jgi:PAS domain S-box-containing protein
VRQLTQTLEKLTARGQPEDAVRARAEALLAYLADVPVAILVANNRARYVDANRHAVALTLYTRAQLMTMQLWDLTPTPNRALGQRLWRAFLRRGRMTGRYELRRKDGSVLPAHYLAIANVLPGVHVSVLVPLTAPRRRRSGTRGAAKRMRYVRKAPQARSRT